LQKEQIKKTRQNDVAESNKRLKRKEETSRGRKLKEFPEQ